MERVFALVLAVILASGCASPPPREWTVGELLEARPVGKNVTVRGTAGPYNLICTQSECPEEDPCCNLCSGELSLAGSLPVRAAGAGCSGNECAQQCSPLDLGSPYTVTGTLQEAGGQLVLIMAGFEQW